MVSLKKLLYMISTSLIGSFDNTLWFNRQHEILGNDLWWLMLMDHVINSKCLEYL